MSESVKSSGLVYDEDGNAHFDAQVLQDIEDPTTFRYRTILPRISHLGFVRDSSGKTLLHHAASAGNIWVVINLIRDIKAEVDARDLQGRTPLMVCYPGSHRITKMLLDHNANMHLVDNDGKSALEQFIDRPVYGNFLDKLSEEYCGDAVKIAKKLIEIKCSISRAVYLKNPELTRLLLEHLFSSPGYSCSPLELLNTCIVNIDLGNFKLLLDRVVDVNCQDSIGRTALIAYGQWDKCHPNHEKLQLILDRGADPTMILRKNVYVPNAYKGRMQMFPLLSHGNVMSINFLLKNGFDVHAKDEHGYTALHYLVLNEDLDFSKLIKIDELFDVNARDNSGSTPLYYVDIMNLSAVKFLINNGADVNAKDNDGKTPLTRIWQEMKNSGAFFSYINYFGKFERSKRVIDYLLCHGADIQIVDEDNQFSFYSSLEHSWHECWIKNLLAQLAVIEASGKDIKECIRKQIANNNKLKKHLDACKSQLEKMKQIKVTKFTSLYELLIKSRSKIETHARNKKLLSNLRRMRNKKKFMTYYRYVLRDRVVKAQNRVRRRKATAAVISEICGLSTDHIVIDKIVKNLNDNDLRKMYVK